MTLGRLIRPGWQRRDLGLALLALAAPIVLWASAAALAERPSIERDYVPPVWQLVLPESAQQPFGKLDDAPTGKALGIGDAIDFGNKASTMRFVSLSAGEFTMGSPESEAGRFDREVRHRVRLSAFLIAEHEVTQAQWKALMRTEPSNCDDGCGDEHPVQRVSWFDAVEFLNALTDHVNQQRQTPLTRCYRIDGENVTWAEGCTGYRLPTEAEWEYAARAGNQAAYSFGNDASRLGEHAWFDGNSGREAHPVGQKKASSWGLYDMHGNILGMGMGLVWCLWIGQSSRSQRTEIWRQARAARGLVSLPCAGSALGVPGQARALEPGQALRFPLRAWRGPSIVSLIP